MSKVSNKEIWDNEPDQKPGGLDFVWLRKGVANTEESACKDLRLCAVDVFESVCYSDDTRDEKIKKINWLNELYLEDKDSYDEAAAENMENLMELMAGFLDRDEK